MNMTLGNILNQKDREKKIDNRFNYMYCFPMANIISYFHIRDGTMPLHYLPLQLSISHYAINTFEVSMLVL